MIIDLSDCTYPVHFEKNALSETIRELILSKEHILIIIDNAIFHNVAHFVLH